MAGTFVSDTIQDGAGNSTSTTNVIQGSAKAWAKFQGGNGNTSGTIVGSYNVSSITTVTTGNYIVNFTNSLPDANYSAVANMIFTSTSNAGYTAVMVGGTQSTTGFYLFAVNSVTGGNTNGQFTNLAVFR